MKERFLLLLKEFLTVLDGVAKDLHLKERGEEKTNGKERRKGKREKQKDTCSHSATEGVLVSQTTSGVH